jgi:hypothetical protein
MPLCWCHTRLVVALSKNKPRALEAREGENMTHPCDPERHASKPERVVISLAYTPEIYARKRAQRLAREAAWRAAEALEGWRCVIRALAIGMARRDHAAAISGRTEAAGPKRDRAAEAQAKPPEGDGDFGPDLIF